MKRLSVLFLVLSMFFFQTQAAFALDNFYITATNNSGGKFIRVYSGTGAHLSDIPIDNAYKNAQFLSGNWIANKHSVVALILKKKNLSAFILDNSGRARTEINLGKNALRIFSLDYNKNGISDLAVQYKKNIVRIYLDPAINAANTTRVKLPALSDAVPLLTLNGANVASLKLEELNKNFLDAKGSTKKLSGKRNFITYKNGSRRKKKIRIATHAQRTFPVLLSEGRVGFIVQSTPKRLQLFGEKVQRNSFVKTTTSKAFTGFFSSNTISDLAIGEALNYSTDTATIRLINPQTKSTRVVTLNLALGLKRPYATQAYSQKVDAAYCNKILALVDKLNAAVAAGNYPEMMRILNILEKEEDNFEECERIIGDNGSNGGGSGGGSANGGDGKTTPGKNSEKDDDYFVANEIGYVTSIVQYGSNTGMARTPCTEILNARDGNMGFLAKNSDFHPGTVYLTPGAGFSNGRVLSPRSYKLIAKTKYTGVANGGRSHFRLYSKRLPFGAHIFAADHYNGGTYCWKVPGTGSRID
ncbi:MAG: hypothetical protein ACOX2O_00605 [Bdellovibrionota bacterium]